jgi:endonuclease/exonuclease/phosphatase (EEP) superfamily protein YafD
VLLLEVDEAWKRALGELADVYPQQHVVARDDHFGLALLSRIPWDRIETLQTGDAELPTVVAEWPLDESGRLTFIGSHPLPPGSRVMAKMRNEQLRELAALAKQTSGPVILAGDLNVTSFSPYFRDLLRDSGLWDSRQGRGIQATWGPMPLLEIAIDHCLLSREFAVRHRYVGPHLGSDHRPVTIDVCLPSSRRLVGKSVSRRAL